MAKHIELKVSFDLPFGATIAEAKFYVLDAVSTWKGSLKPPGVDETDPRGDPMFELDETTVRVIRPRKPAAPKK